MIRVTVTYPATEGARFDHDYYAASHIPLAASIWKPEKYEIDRGINGGSIAAGHFYFDSLDSFQTAMGSSGTAEITADVPNYTDLAPRIQVSEIVVG